MERPRNALAGLLDRIIGGLSGIRDRLSGDTGATSPDPPPSEFPESAQGNGGDPQAGLNGSDADSLATAVEAEAPATVDESGIAAGLRDRIGRNVDYTKTVLRHPVAAQRAHLSALRNESPFSLDFWKEVTLATSDIKSRRTDMIRDQLAADRTLRDDARAAAATVDWRRTWRYGKYGYLAGRRYRKQAPVADAYAPVAGAIAAGTYGAVTGATDRVPIDVDPDRLFDKIDAVSRLKNDPVTRAQMARETIRAVDRRVGTDDLPVEEVVDDADIAQLVVGQDEAVPDEIPPVEFGLDSRRVEDLVFGDPLPPQNGAPRLAPGDIGDSRNILERDQVPPVGSEDPDSGADTADRTGDGPAESKRTGGDDDGNGPGDDETSTDATDDESAPDLAPDEPSGDENRSATGSW